MGGGHGARCVAVCVRFVPLSFQAHLRPPVCNTQQEHPEPSSMQPGMWATGGHVLLCEWTRVRVHAQHACAMHVLHV
jgi:hypothetical protein